MTAVTVSSDPLCHLCPYNRDGQQRVRGTDLERPRIVVGMAPGVEEAMRNTPFVGPSGAPVPGGTLK